MVIRDEENKPYLLMATFKGVGLFAIGHGDDKGGQIIVGEKVTSYN